MTFEEFERRARLVFARVPAEMRVGVDALVVERDAVPDPELADVWLLGECATGEWDAPLDLPDQLRSTVILHYGSFAALAELDPEFDWEYEIWETVVHEIRHHRESAAGDDALEEVDYAEAESFARREGRPFDPFFFRLGEPVGPGAWEVDGETYLERPITSAEWERVEEVEVPWDDVVLHVPREGELGDVQFVALEQRRPQDPAVTVVLVRRRGAWESLRAVFRTDEVRVVEREAPVRVERIGSP